MSWVEAYAVGIVIAFLAAGVGAVVSFWREERASAGGKRRQSR